MIAKPAPTASHERTDRSVTGPVVWGIADLAQDFDITPRTLRFYEDKGLISPSRESGVRVYGPPDRERLTHIMRAKRLGFSLDDIKEVFDVMLGEVTDRSELLRRKGNFERVIGSLARRQDDIAIVRHNLTDLCARIQGYIDDPDQGANVLQFAGAYDAALRAHMDDDF